jgi:HAMP domain-containing protein
MTLSKRNSLLLVLLCLSPWALGQIPFWDDVQTVGFKAAGFPQTVANSRQAGAFWQVKTSVEGGWPQYYLAFTGRTSTQPWSEAHNVLGPFTLTGGDSQFYSAVWTESGDLWVAVLEAEGQLMMYRSRDAGASFEKVTTLSSPRTQTLLVPRLFLGPDNQPLLVVNEAEEVSIRLAASVFRAGAWSPLTTIRPDSTVNSYQPAIAVAGKTLTLVYQSPNNRNNYQIFRRDSTDGGLTWGDAVLLSDFDPTVNPELYDNQRPNALWWNNRLYVAWERKTAGTQTLIQWLAYDVAGKLVPGSPRELTANDYAARNPQLFAYNGRVQVGWFDNQGRSYDQSLATWSADLTSFTVKTLSDGTGSNYLGQAVSLAGELYYFWQSVFGTGNASTSRILFRGPDRRAEAPQIRAVSFVAGRASNNAEFRIQVVYPKDISGIQGFSWLLSTDETSAPEARLTDTGKSGTGNDPTLTVRASAEGTSWLSVRVLDTAGNWSPPARQALVLDLTPPGPVLFDLPAVDPQGFLASNTFQLGWKTTTGDGVAYSWRLNRIGEFSVPATLVGLKLEKAPAVPTGTGALFFRDNLEDGVWALTVAAFDEAGNQGPSTNFFFRLNKYRPFTSIQSVVITEEDFQRFLLEIRGLGFVAGGQVTAVVLDRDGKAPWDYLLPPLDLTDKKLSARAADLPQGVYRIGVIHSERGVLLASKTLEVGVGGTVKIGDFRNLDQSVWEFFDGIRAYFSVNTAFFWVIFVFLTLAIVVSVSQLRRFWGEMRRVDRQADELFTDTYTRRAAFTRSTVMKRKGRSLTFKFATSILSLTVAVILMLALVLGFLITENSRASLGNALQQRADVLLEGLASGARANLPTAENNLSELLLLPSQIASMQKDAQHQDALFATITGRSTNKAAGYSYIWSSNDPQLAIKIDTPELRRGLSTWKSPDAVEKAYLELQRTLNQSARQRVGTLVTQVDDVNKQILGYTGNLTDAKLVDLRAQLSDLKTQIAAQLGELGKGSYTQPTYDTATLLTSGINRYQFYKPVLYYSENDNENFVKGLVRLEVSTESIVRDITSAQTQLVTTTLLVALVALALGLIGALVLSRITVNPIRKLVKGVEEIRAADDKTKLKGHVIEINTGDELSELAQSINQMTRGLVDGAKKTQDLTKGKVEQKTLFIPLDKDTENQKLTTFHTDLEDIEVFAYYEGAILVSGDLYEFRRLDTRNGKNADSPWFGIMKGDVSGKGVEAGMIMAIAAMFVTTFFRRWTEARDAKNTLVDNLLFQINDTLEPILAEAGRGLFVALNVGVLNAKTGHLRYGQAGDNVLHVWRGREGRYETVPLPNTISVGAMPTKDHRADLKYANRDLMIEVGDTLLYFTDGIEESQSAFRGADWQEVAYFNPNDPTTIAAPGARKEIQIEGAPEGVRRTVQAQGTEDFGPERMQAVIEAFYRREVYELRKKNCADPDLVYHFDFRSCDGSAKQLVTAMISIDRIFRLVPDPKATAEDRIQLDLVEDAFLREFFTEYPKYFHDGEQDYERADKAKGDVQDGQGFKLLGGERVPNCERADPAKGDVSDKEGFKLVDLKRVPNFVRADTAKGEVSDGDGFKLVGGKRVPNCVRAEPAKGDLADEQGFKLLDGERVPNDLRADKTKGDVSDDEGFKLVAGKRVRDYQIADRRRGDVSDSEGYKLVGKRVPRFQRADKDKGDISDAQGFRLLGGMRIEDFQRADKANGHDSDAQGFKLEDGKRILNKQPADKSRGDVADAEGYRLVGGKRVMQDPAYIWYSHLKEDHQFDDLTLLAIRRK